MTPWKSILKTNFHQTPHLLDYLAFDEENRKKILEKAKFCLNVPRRLADKMGKNDPKDPLFLQFVPLKKELEKGEKGILDPVSDRSFQRTPHLLQKYQGRALVIASGACAMHCRFCFRQNYDYDSSYRTFEKEIDLIQNDPSLHEVILSGGDPLSLSDRELESLLERLDAIDHIKIIRFHTRFPIGIPERISVEFLEILKKISKQIVMILHINHPNELDDELFMKVKEIQKLGILVLSQTVFLKDVNDSVKTLKELLFSLVSQGILPYYLHSLDSVEGALHFEAPIEQGLEIIEELRKELPGYAIPRFVKEIPGEPNKTPLLKMC